MNSMGPFMIMKVRASLVIMLWVGNQLLKVSVVHFSALDIFSFVRNSPII